MQWKMIVETIQMKGIVEKKPVCSRSYKPIPSVQLMGMGYVTSFYRLGSKTISKPELGSSDEAVRPTPVHIPH